MAFLDTLNRLLGDPNKKELKKLWPVVHEVRRACEAPSIRALTLETLPRKTEEMKAKAQAGLASLDELLPEAFATAIRACELLQGKTVAIGRQEFRWDMAPFDVQILGGAALHRGCIAEMRTGEGKTLVCTLPVYLNALLGKGVHVVTVNDYLAKRDARWMGMLYEALGLTVGMILHEVPTEDRRTAYACDVTYGTNSEFGFDYLRDNMAPSVAQQVQRGLHYAIVDEVDSILIDEARTPLIISQPAEESTAKYVQYAQLVSNLQENVHYNTDEKQRAVALTEEGIKTMEQLLGVENIYTERGFEEVHHIEQALRAHGIYKRDVDYVVKENEVIIVDEFTGRLMPGRRYSNGLHQALEAKEKVTVQRESKTLATITFQNYFRLFTKLAGMTGTAKTEEEEFESIYKLRTIVIPTHRSMIRADNPDAIYRTMSAKFKAVAKIAKEKHAQGQPVLIGTTSIEKSEVMSILLDELGVLHQVLNAKQHEKEAEIIAKAGQKGAITIATNMAGRGTDIKLGEGVQALGGLVILGTERHEARRIDNQLRGRSGRQGDPGESQFFVSMEDDLMRLFGGDRLKSMMERLKVPDDVPLENRMVSRSIEGAQKKVEGRNFDIRRHVLQYDDVMNKHREIIYKRRQKVLEKIVEMEERSSPVRAEQRSGGLLDHAPLLDADTQDTTRKPFDSAQGGRANERTRNIQWPLHDEILTELRSEVSTLVALHASTLDSEEWNFNELYESLTALHAGFGEIITREHLATFNDSELLKERLTAMVVAFYEEKCKSYPPEIVARAESIITLRSIDTHWMDHIDDMAHLREQVAFSGFAQRDPLIEYQDQGFRRFQQLLATVQSTIVRTLLQAEFSLFAPQVIMAETQGLQQLTTNQAQIEGELLQTGVDTKIFAQSNFAEASPDAASNGNLVTMQSQIVRAPTAAPRTQQKVGRNDPCPCGSGKKHKKCHGREA
ncbi:preprotein translocase subunit SecA [Candidatus Peregrinibacteria bacterium]|nr:preprotein translocase subunit SecA [Candidatus Peregrinibacteria bacterium]MBI3817021.1 preprotein translocase subunit SecA [Candidatus Peregrinibacteria bacterium]